MNERFCSVMVAVVSKCTVFWYDTFVAMRIGNAWIFLSIPCGTESGHCYPLKPDIYRISGHFMVFFFIWLLKPWKVLVVDDFDVWAWDARENRSTHTHTPVRTFTNSKLFPRRDLFYFGCIEKRMYMLREIVEHDTTTKSTSWSDHRSLISDCHRSFCVLSVFVGPCVKQQVNTTYAQYLHLANFWMPTAHRAYGRIQRRKCIE